MEFKLNVVRFFAHERLFLKSTFKYDDFKIVIVEKSEKEKMFRLNQLAVTMDQWRKRI